MGDDVITVGDEALLVAAIEVAGRARRNGNHPFGALLAGPDGAVELRAENTVVTLRDATGHAETNLVRMATARFDRAELWGRTLYTSTEPCAMCAGAIYWAGIGRVVYALGEAALYEITGSNPENPTLRLPCREVFGRGQTVVAVDGPAERLDAQARAVHEGFWD